MKDSLINSSFLSSPYRRQKDIVNPTLFDIAISGDKDGLYQLLEDGDDVNPSVRISHTLNHTPLLLILIRMMYQIGPFLLQLVLDT